MSKTLSVIIGMSTILLMMILDETFCLGLGVAGRIAIACVLDVIVIAIIGLCKEG
jgi:hypothetical protein